MKVIILVVLILLNLVRSCYIAGTDSGVCVNEPSFDKQWRATNMPFCGQYVQYAACVPKQQVYIIHCNYDYHHYYCIRHYHLI